MTGILNILAGALGVAKDTYFNLVSLLLPGNGTNGAQNNTFLDASTNNFTITRNGNTTQGTFSPFSQTGWGNYFDGTANGSLRADSTTDTNLSGDFTIQAWVFPTANGQSSGTEIISRGAAATSNGWHFGLTASTTQIYFGLNYGGTGASVYTQSSTNIPLNQWTHVAVTRSGNTCRIYINGVVDTTNTGFTGTPTVSGTEYVYVGRGSYDSTNRQFTGYINNASIIKGTALTTFSQTQPLATGTSGQALLTCTANRFIDTNTATTAKTLTAGSGASVVAFSPFAPTAAYTTAAVGGSGYFDGTGDYLSVADNAAFDFGSGAFTVEAWFYRTGGGDRISQTVYNQSALAAASNSALFFGAGNNGLSLYLSTGGSSWTNSIETGVAPALNAWSHVVWQRNGNTLEIYLNGALQTVVSGTAAFSGTIFNSSRDVEIGIQASTNGPLFGNLCNLRVVKGATVYTGNFTPPTGQLATSGSASAAAYPSTTNVNTSFASSACSLLLNFTNAGITDATAKNDLETVGNAQISTSVSKFPGGSIAFDGSGDYLMMPASSFWGFGTGDFTIEFWWYPNTLATYQQIIMNANDVGPTGTGEYVITYNTTLGLRFFIDSGTTVIQQGSTSGWSTGQWYYVAAVRSGNTLTLYRNGSSIGSGSVTGVTIGSSSVPFYLGGEPYTPVSINGYVQDLRVTKGYARTITASPTAPFPRQ